ncbi:aldehyde dehydrogenase family protein [Ornithinimicrobium sediminis]|uniref:aldehyde dehydrogenase family protein n=1 Tax=Ornithinimicrobium sediminis TaxID=2904603 RepID=UPI001E2F572F|nr:aldehyde dehydrogenase family protein [Ornithinimicrobium sediminis]
MSTSTSARRAPAAGRVDVRKTYKLYIGGAFPRSESGRSYEVYAAPRGSRGSTPVFLANVAKGSRKDARNAVAAARKAVGGWSGATAYNRGQVLYRIAEVMESRRSTFVEDVRIGEGLTPARAEAVVSAAIDRWVWYAGWADKFAQVTSTVNPVAGPFFNISAPEPTGVVALLAPQESSLLGLVSVVAPAIVTGNTCVVLPSRQRPLPAVDLAEALATSDVPGGVVNIVTCHTAEVAPWLASHRDVNAIDLTGTAGVEDLAWGELELAAAESVTRVLRPAGRGPAAVEEDFTAEPGTARMQAFVETKTVWHPKGL